MEVGPGSFHKIKMLGRGDVGKVYLVREKKTGKLFAMKGAPFPPPSVLAMQLNRSTIQSSPRRR